MLSMCVSLGFHVAAKRIRVIVVMTTPRKITRWSMQTEWFVASVPKNRYYNVSVKCQLYISNMLVTCQ